MKDDSDWWQAAPAEVLRMEFPTTPVGRRGLQSEPVEQFRRWVLESLERAGTESAALRAEIERLHQYIRSQWHTSDVAAGKAAQAGSVGDRTASGVTPARALPEPAATVPAQGGTPIAQALEVLARAQAIADQRVAAADSRLAQAEQRIAEAETLVANAEKRAAMARDQARHLVLEADEVIADRWSRAEHEITARLEEAEQEALDVVARACREYEDILTRAHRRAEHAAERALDDFRDEQAHDLPGRATPADLEMKAAYLQTFAKVSGAALRATLDITRQEFQRLRPQGDPAERCDLDAVRILRTGELEVVSTPPAGLVAIGRRGHTEQVRSGALLSGIIRPAVPAS